MINRNKRGFTIVELVIVIAVIAILAAVLIPTFAGIINTSKTSSDVQLVKNLNLALATAEALNGKNPTMHDALADAKEAGYDVTKLTPTNDDNDILWDQTCDRFVLKVKPTGEYHLGGRYEDIDVPSGADEYKLWMIYDEVPTAQTYSIYYNGADIDSANVSVGFDAGDASVASVSYVNNGSTPPQNVVIRTNGGNLTIDAPADTVMHYGDASVIDVQAVADASYHEFGLVSMLKFLKGRFVAEQYARVSTLYVLGSEAKINIDVLAEVGLMAKAEGVSPAEFTVGGEDKSAEVLEKTEAAMAQFEAAATRYAGGDGSAAYPFLISKYDHIETSLREDVSNGVSLAKYYKLIADIDLGSNFVPLGTVEWEYTGEQSAHVVWSSSKPFEGSFDGDGHTITLKQNNDGCACLFNAIKYGYPIGGYIVPYYFKNVTFNVDLKAAQNASVIANTASSYGYKSTKLYVQNVTVNGTIEGDTGAASLFMSVGSQTNSLLKFENITNNANITVHKFISNGTGSYVICAGIVGTVLGTAVDGEADFINCRNNGDLVCDLIAPSAALINTNTSKYNTIMGHMVGQTFNTTLTNGKTSIIKFIGCSFRADAKLEGYSAKDGKLATFEGYDKSAGKYTYSGEANFNKQLMGGSLSSNVFVGNDADHLTEYVLIRKDDGTAQTKYFVHGGVEGTNGRLANSTANYPSN